MLLCISCMSGFLSRFVQLPSLFDVPARLVQVSAELRPYLQARPSCIGEKVRDGCVTSKKKRQMCPTCSILHGVVINIEPLQRALSTCVEQIRLLSCSPMGEDACTFSACPGRMDWMLPESPDEPPPAHHPHKPESPQQIHCPLSASQMLL